MALGAVLAAALNTAVIRRASLLIDGLDVILSPGSGGNLIGVPLQSIEVYEAGPGDVSSMTFAVEDPLSTAALPQSGSDVRLWDNVRDVPLFGGYVQAWTVSPAFGGQGRLIQVTCAGYEAILDWAVLAADVTFASGTFGQVVMQSIVANAIGVGPINATSPAGGVSTQANPVASLSNLPFGGQMAYALTIVAGTSLREALRQVSAATLQTNNPDNVGTVTGIVFTVDFYLGLRAYADSASTSVWASDYTDLTVTDTVAGTPPASELGHTKDGMSVARGVYIKGGNAAGTGILMDGSGKPGRIAYISDSTIDTATKLLNAQRAYLSRNAIATRGDLVLDDWAPTGNVRPGSLLILTDVATAATGTYRIKGIGKRFTGVRETWRVDYGQSRLSAVNLVRQLTSDTRN